MVSPPLPVPSVPPTSRPPLVAVKMFVLTAMSPPPFPRTATRASSAKVTFENKLLEGKLSLKVLPFVSSPTVPAAANPPNSIRPPAAVSPPPADKFTSPPTSAKVFPDGT